MTDQTDDHAEIWLDCKCTEPFDRMWSVNKTEFEEVSAMECGKSCTGGPVKYIRADLHDAAIAVLQDEHSSAVRRAEKADDALSAAQAEIVRLKSSIETICHTAPESLPTHDAAIAHIAELTRERDDLQITNRENLEICERLEAERDAALERERALKIALVKAAIPLEAICIIGNLADRFGDYGARKITGGVNAIRAALQPAKGE